MNVLKTGLLSVIFVVGACSNSNNKASVGGSGEDNTYIISQHGISISLPECDSWIITSAETLPNSILFASVEPELGICNVLILQESPGIDIPVTDYPDQYIYDVIDRITEQAENVKTVYQPTDIQKKEQGKVKSISFVRKLTIDSMAVIFEGNIYSNNGKLYAHFVTSSATDSLTRNMVLESLRGFEFVTSN